MELPTDYTKIPPSVRREVRNEYIKLQDNKCYWCGYSLSNDPPSSVTDKKIDWKRFPPNFLQYPVHLQHCHKTGMTEGAVHAYCNAVMWQYEGR